jgi:ankyrin repeat protein
MNPIKKKIESNYSYLSLFGSISLIFFVLSCSSIEERVAEYAYDGELNKVKESIERLGTPNIRTPEKWTPLMTASENGHMKIVQYLIENGAHLDLRNELGDTALMRATSNNQPEIVEYLIKSGASKLLRNKKGYTPFLKACEKGNLKLIKLLYNSKTDLTIQTQNSDKLFPLHLLSYSKSPEDSLKFMLEEGVDLNSKDENGRTALMHFIMNKKTNLAKLLIEKGASIYEISKFGETPLILARETIDPELETILMKKIKN